MPALPFWTVFAPFTCIERPGGRTHSSHWLCVAYRASRIEWPRRHCWFDLLGCLVSYLDCVVLLHWLLLAAAEELTIAGTWPSVPCFIKGPSIRPRSHDTKKTLRHTPLQEGSYSSYTIVGNTQIYKSNGIWTHPQQGEAFEGLLLSPTQQLSIGIRPKRKPKAKVR